jgi:hypothetical protein
MPRTPDPGALEYELRGDHVTGRRQPAYRTGMPPLRKSLGHGRSAYAHLAGSTRIHLHQLSPGACSLVPELGKETVPSGVVDRAGQYAARKPLDVEVFDRDQPVAFHQPGAEIMMKGGSVVSDFTVRLGHQYGGLAAATAAALATEKPALGGKVILSYRRTERKRRKPGFSPRLTRAENAWKVLSSPAGAAHLGSRRSLPVRPTLRPA